MTEYSKKGNSLQKTDLNTLIKNAQKNIDNGASFTEICRRFSNLIKKYANQAHLGSVREDALGEAWLALVSAVQSYDENQKTNAAGYIESCVRYALWNLFKKLKRQWEREVPAISTSYDNNEPDILETVTLSLDVASYVADKLDYENRAAAVEKAVSTLSPKQQFIIKKTFFDEHSLTQAAAEMKITPQAAFSLQKRGLRQLETIDGLRTLKEL